MIGLVRGRIATKLTMMLVGFVAVVLLVSGAYLELALSSFATGTLEARLFTAARLLHDEARALIARGADTAVIEAFAARVAGPAGSRVTIISGGGRVLGDSGVAIGDLARVENHADRPEVKAALRGVPGRDVRTSATVREPLFYVGLPIRDGDRVIGALRLALPLSVVSASHRAIARTLLAGGVLALIVAAGVGVLVSRQITKPVVEMQRIAGRMSEGDFRARAPVRSSDEIGTLARALNAMATRLQDKIDDLEHEHAKVTTILDTMVDGVIAVNGHDDVLLINEPARRLFDVLPGQGARKPLVEVVRHAELHATVRLARGAVEGTALTREILLGDRTPRRLQVHAMPLRLGPRPLGVVVVLHDVTDLRRLEQIRTEFVANVSHELRTPLTAIHGYVETLLGSAAGDPAERQRFLEIVQHHTERLGRLLNDLTDLSNLELGRIALDLGPVRVADVAESVGAILGPRAHRAAVSLAVAIPPDLPPVHADHDRLSEILINLVDNAIKYTPAGGRVTVCARAADRRVEVAVADTGVGIPPADLPRVTERFYRVDKARSRDLGGTGLGLAIVKHLVQAHAGELFIESEPHRGTTVRVRLPVATT